MWLEDTGNKNFKLDKRFRRKIISFGPFLFGNHLEFLNIMI